MARVEITRFWEQRGCATSKESPLSLCVEFAAPALASASTSEASFEAVCSGYAERVLLKFMEIRLSDEELRKWLLRPDVLYAETP